MTMKHVVTGAAVALFAVNADAQTQDLKLDKKLQPKPERRLQLEQTVNDNVHTLHFFNADSTEQYWLEVVDNGNQIAEPDEIRKARQYKQVVSATGAKASYTVEVDGGNASEMINHFNAQGNYQNSVSAPAVTLSPKKARKQILKNLVTGPR